MMRRKFIPLAIIFFLMYAALAWIYGWSAHADVIGSVLVAHS